MGWLAGLPLAAALGRRVFDRSVYVRTAIGIGLLQSLIAVLDHARSTATNGSALDGGGAGRHRPCGGGAEQCTDEDGVLLGR